MTRLTEPRDIVLQYVGRKITLPPPNLPRVYDYISYFDHGCEFFLEILILDRYLMPS
jgi:hypothetical protein